jgi:hypothetical protein
MPGLGSQDGRTPSAGGEPGAPLSRASSPVRAPADQSDDELYDILVHIDRRANPERYQSVRDEYVRRHGEKINGHPVDAYFDRARLERPFAERSRFKKRMLLGLAIWSLFMLALRGVIYLSEHWRGH